MAHYAFSDAAGNNIANWRAGLTFHPSGAIDVDNSLERADGLPVMPRLGMNVELIRRLDDVEWLGRGPFENYSDRNTAASVGRYSNTVADHYVPTCARRRTATRRMSAGCRWRITATLVC